LTARPSTAPPSLGLCPASASTHAFASTLGQSRGHSVNGGHCESRSLHPRAHSRPDRIALFSRRLEVSWGDFKPDGLAARRRWPFHTALSEGGSGTPVLEHRTAQRPRWPPCSRGQMARETRIPDNGNWRTRLLARERGLECAVGRAGMRRTRANSRNVARAGARSAKTAITLRAGNATSGSAASSSSCSGGFTADCAGAVGGDRRLFSITSTGKKISIRGVLCQNCNRGIGLLGDDIDGVRRALEYLNRHEARKPFKH
jgi:recombination endonuclease VII